MFCRRLWKPRSNPYLKGLPVLVMIFSLGMAACSPGLPVISVPPEPETLPSETAEEAEIHPVAPTPSATIEPLPERVILLAPPESNPLLLEEVQAVIEELVEREGYLLEIIPSLSPEQITPDVHMVIGLPPDPGLERLAEAASETKFFAIGMPGLDEKPNLIPAFFHQGGADRQGFMGGVVAALVTQDWRIGAISVSDSTEGEQARTGFINGAIYFCGTCRQIYPPFFDSQNQLIQYPLFVELPSTASDNEWQSAADYLIERGVETVYVFPEAGGEGLLSYLADSGMNIIGGILPPEGLKKNWVASIYSDASGSWQARLEMALLGQELPEISGELQIAYANPDLFSPGRQKLAEAVLEDLLAGFIEAGLIEEPVSEP